MSSKWVSVNDVKSYFKQLTELVNKVDDDHWVACGQRLSDDDFKAAMFGVLYKKILELEAKINPSNEYLENKPKEE